MDFHVKNIDKEAITIARAETTFDASDQNFADFKYLKQMLLESQTFSVVHLKYSNIFENVLLTS